MYKIRPTFILLVIVASIALMLFQSCGSGGCSCSMQCQYFKHDSIAICSNSYTSATAYQAALDYAFTLYGNAVKDTSWNNVEFGRDNNQVAMFESRGYACQCFDGGW